MQHALFVLLREHHPFPIRAHAIVAVVAAAFHGIPRQHPVALPARQVHAPQFRFVASFHSLQIKQRLPISRKRRESCRSFRRYLPVPFSLVDPYRHVRRSHRCQERASILLHRDAFFLRRPARHLLRLALREPFSPDVISPSLVRAHVHPFSVRRPRARRALGVLGSHAPRRFLSPKRHQLARCHLPLPVHLHYQHPPAVRGQI